MRSFEDWFDQYENKNEYAAKQIAKDAYEMGLQHCQTEVDELKLQVAEMKSRLNDAYTDGQSAMYIARQSKVDELQANYHGAMIGHNHHLGKVKKERDELQKRVDATANSNKQVEQRLDRIQQLTGEYPEVQDLCNEIWEILFVEQALKGGNHEAN